MRPRPTSPGATGRTSTGHLRAERESVGALRPRGLGARRGGSWEAPAMSDLNGKVALVTGASGGIGAATAAELHAAGAKVGLLSRRGDDLHLDGARGVACDVRDREAVS